MNSLPSLSVNVAFSNSITITNITAGSLEMIKVNAAEISSNKLIGGQDNDLAGIHGRDVQNSTFDNNYIWEFDVGIILYRCSDILVTENTIEDCFEYGIIPDFVGTVYHNNFIDNNQAVYGIPSAISILWDDGYPSGCNYWSDEVRTDVYQGPHQNETGSDGIADMPYVTFNGTEYGYSSIVDRYPLIGPWTVKGENVTVTPSNAVTVTFDNTTSGGITIVNSNSSGPDPPSGFKLESASPQYYEINTTANYDGPITIGISYNDSDMTLEKESALRLMHWNATASMWTDITTSVDTTNNVVYGETEHLSTFTVVWTVPPVDMRVRKVDSKSMVGRGYILSVNLTVENQGYLETMFNSSLYANNSVVDASSGIDLQGGVTEPIYLPWNTSGDGYGNYTLKACIPPCVNETDISDNNCTYSVSVHIGVPGDVSGTTPGAYDGIVNMKDVAYLVSLFQTKPNKPNWNPNADVNNDGVVDMKDIATAVYYFNQHE